MQTAKSGLTRTSWLKMTIECYRKNMNGKRENTDSSWNCTGNTASDLRAVHCTECPISSETHVYCQFSRWKRQVILFLRTPLERADILCIRPIGRRVITRFLKCNPEGKQNIRYLDLCFRMKNAQLVVSPRLTVSCVLRLVHYYFIQSIA